MAARYVTIGSMVNMHIFDDTGPSAYAFDTDGQMFVGTAPTLGDEVLRLDDVGVLAGDVFGPAASTDNALVKFHLATGKIIQNSGAILDDNNVLNLAGLGPNLVTKTNDYTATVNDTTILIDGSANTVTLTLPTAVGINRRIYNIKCIDDTFLCDVATDGSEEIDEDSSNFSLAQHEVITIQSDNANWWII